MKNNITERDSITCEVIQDLLPLYEDDCCSGQSRKIVEEHLKKCAECRGKRSQYEKTLPPMDEQQEIDLKGIKQEIHKITRWKRMGIAALCLALILVFGVLPTWNYVKGSGITYTNLKAAYIAYAFEKAIVAGDYEKAYGYLDIESHYKDLLATEREAQAVANGEKDTQKFADAKAIDAGIQKIEENGFDWYNQVCKEKFMSNMAALESAGEIVCSYSNFCIDTQAWGWSIQFRNETVAGTEFIMDLDISIQGIENYSIMMEEDSRMLERLYTTPTINETVMELLYENTEFDWRKLFAY